ncbi:MAG: phosphotransferase [Thermomicrobiales bacterium]
MIARVAPDAGLRVVLAARSAITLAVARWGEGAAMTYCHGDATLDNLIVAGDEIGFFDFDLAGWSWRVFGMVSLAGRAMTDPARAGSLWAAYREGYTAVSPPSEADDRLLPAFVVAHALWGIAHDIRCSAGWFGDWMLPGPDRFQRLARLCDVAFPGGMATRHL